MLPGPAPKILRPGMISERDLLDKIGSVLGANNSSYQASLYSSGRAYSCTRQ